MHELHGRIAPLGSILALLCVNACGSDDPEQASDSALVTDAATAMSTTGSSTSDTTSSSAVNNTSATNTSASASTGTPSGAGGSSSASTTSNAVSTTTSGSDVGGASSTSASTGSDGGSGGIADTSTDGGMATDAAGGTSMVGGDTWTNFAAEFFGTYCVECHNEDNTGVATRDYTMLSVVMAESGPIACGVATQATRPSLGCEAGDPQAEQFPNAAIGIEPTAEERERLVAWIEAGMPE